MRHLDRVVQALGWAGALAVLAAYALTSLGAVRPDGAASLALNIAGASAIAAASWRRRAFQSVFVNAVWVSIGVATLIKGMLL